MSCTWCMRKHTTTKKGDTPAGAVGVGEKKMWWAFLAPRSSCANAFSSPKILKKEGVFSLFFSF